MSFPQFGYAYPPSAAAAATSLASSQILMSSGSHTPTSCCETGRPIMTDPHTGQTVCSCQYTSALLNYSGRVPGLPESVYTSPYAAAAAAQGYGLSPDGPAFYLNSAYDLKDSAEAWRSACYPYDPSTMAAYPYGPGYGTMDLNGARRKNATRETTSTLKAWLYEHRKNPYPTKGEKIMLAIITKMTLTQVSTWFANARRRLKKDNKMTWSPRNRTGDEDPDDLDSDGEGCEDKTDAGEEKDKDEDINIQVDDSLSDIEYDIQKEDTQSTDENLDLKRDSGHLPLTSTPLKPAAPGSLSQHHPLSVLSIVTDSQSTRPKVASTVPTSSVPANSVQSATGHSSSSSLSFSSNSSSSKPHHHQHGGDSTVTTVSQAGILRTSVVTSTTAAVTATSSTSSSSTNTASSSSTSTKPRIWSLAHTATSNSPPPTRRSPVNISPAHRSQPSPAHEDNLTRGQNFVSPMDSLRKWIDTTNGRSRHPSLGFSHPYLLTGHGASKPSVLSPVNVSSQMDALQTGPRSAFVSPNQNKLITNSRPTETVLASTTWH